MKRIIALLSLALVANAAYAFECVEYVDKDGIGRWNCRNDKPAAKGDFVEKELKVPTDVRFIGETGPGNSFVLIDNTNDIIKRCVNMYGSIECN